MSSIHQEKYFQSEIIEHLTAHGWVEGHDSAYDKTQALYPEDVLAWVQVAHPEAWAKLEGMHGAKAGAQVMERLVKELENQGTLAILRHERPDDLPERRATPGSTPGLSRPIRNCAGWSSPGLN